MLASLLVVAVALLMPWRGPAEAAGPGDGGRSHESGTEAASAVMAGHEPAAPAIGREEAPSAATPARSTVAVVRSDHAGLTQSVPADSQLSEGQIEEIVRSAVSLAGGLQSVIKPDARWIAVKVNIVEATKPGSGVITDPRVVKAVVKLAHEAAPNARISIAEGPGEWISPDTPGADSLSRFPEMLTDGWRIAGYRELLKHPDLQGMNVDLVDLNVDDPVLTPVPAPWFARESYWVPRTALECDALIDVPVMKTHDGPGITCAMKNFVGMAPGVKYGWAKATGAPGGGPGIPHTPQIIDETIVDLTSLARPKFTVVDAIVCVEKEKSLQIGGASVRMNTIVAGADIVAVDATCARIMGLNPDDIEFLTLAARKGIGQAETNLIEVKGSGVEAVRRRFEKPPREMMGMWGEYGHYGQSNRTWLLNGTFPLGDKAPIDPRAKIVPGENGWSTPVYFGDDRIDLRSRFKDAHSCAAYAYSAFAVAEAQDAELWAGSGEGLTVWIDGSEVYSTTGTRQHKLPNDKEKVRLTAGDHALLVRIEQTLGAFDFSLNICEVEADERYSGNRLPGLKFTLPATGSAESVAASEVESFRIDEWIGKGIPSWLETGAWTTYPAEQGHRLQRIRSISFGADSSVWVSGRGGVACLKGGVWRNWGPKDGLEGDHVNCVLADYKGHVWAMTNKVLYEYDGAKWWNRRGGSWDGWLAEDSKGRIWYAGGWEQGLSVYDGSEWKVFSAQDGFAGGICLGVACDGRGRVWIATFGGGVVSLDGGKWASYTTFNSGLKDNHVRFLAIGPRGDLLVCSEGGGVARMRDGVWKAWGKGDGLNDLSSSSAAIDARGNTWVVFSSFFGNDENSSLAFFDGRNWTVGLAGGGVNCIAADTHGNVWVGSGDRLAQFSPGAAAR